MVSVRFFLPPATHTNLYGPKSARKAIVATVAGNHRVTAVGKDDDTPGAGLRVHAVPGAGRAEHRHRAPRLDASGRPHAPRQYSVASRRNGERPGCNNLALTVKRVLQDHQGRPVRGVASNYLCDLKVGDAVQVIGPFGASFLMPNHPRSHVVMICTGTGSAPMRAMTEWRRRLRASGRFEAGKLMLFLGARSPRSCHTSGRCRSCPRTSSTSTWPSAGSPASRSANGQARLHLETY